MTTKNKILSLELELGDGGKWHTYIKVLCGAILRLRGYEVTSGRECLDEGINPDLVAKKTEKITSERGKVRKATLEYWVEVIDSSDRHLEDNKVINAVTDIIKIHIKKIKLNKPFASIVEGLEYRLPE